MNRCVGGKPRAGKTKRAVVWIVEQLRSHRRPIVTNMALKLGPWVDGKGKAHKGLLRTLQDRYGETYDAERRIYILSHEEVRRFYAIRPMIPKDEWEARTVETVPRYDMWKFDANKYPGCCYVIDEAEVYFPSQSVNATTSAHEDVEILQWAKQAGRGGDDALFISQNIVWISKKLRGTCQECWQMVNHVHVNFGFFRRPDRITEETFANCPPNQGEERLKYTTMYYDKEDIEGSYNTAEGVGVTGNTSADIGQKAKGLHWGWIPAGIVGIGIFALIGLMAFKATVTAAFNRQQKGAKDQVSAQLGQGANGKMVQSTQAFSEIWKALSELKTNRVLVAPAVEVRKPVVREIVGWAKGTAGFACALPNGHSFMAKNVEDMGNEAVIDGVLYKIVSGRASEEKGSEGNHK